MHGGRRKGVKREWVTESKGRGKEGRRKGEKREKGAEGKVKRNRS